MLCGIALKAFRDAPDRQPDIEDGRFALFAVKMLLKALAAEPGTTLEMGREAWRAIDRAVWQMRNPDLSLPG